MSNELVDMPVIEWSEINAHYRNLTTKTLEDIIRQEVRNAKMAFISLGFFLRVAKEQETWKKQGYDSIWEYAEKEFHISRSTASRYMEINRRFSKEGCSTILDERYQDYNVGQLQEMLTLPDTQEVTPDMTVKEIRALKPKRAKKEAVPAAEICATSHMEEPEEVFEVVEDNEASVEELIETLQTSDLEVTDDVGEPLEVEDEVENTYTDEWFVKNFFETEEGKPYLTKLVALCKNINGPVGEDMADRVEARAICCPNNCLNTVETDGMAVEFKSLLFGVTFHAYINGNEFKRHMGWGHFLRLIDKLYNTDEPEGVEAESESVAETSENVAITPETSETVTESVAADPIQIEVKVTSGNAKEKWEELVADNKTTIRENHVYRFLIDVMDELKDYRTCEEEGSSFPEDTMRRGRNGLQAVAGADTGKGRYRDQGAGRRD